MNATSGYKASLAEIGSLMDRSKYAEALQAVESLLEKWPAQPALLVFRGELIQLQEDDGPSLDEAATALKQATQLDPRNADAWLEWGSFQFAVQDDAKAAEKSFSQAISTASDALISALIGRAGALEELGRTREAFELLVAARYLQSSPSTSNGSGAKEVDLFERFESLISQG